jgi:hypothetical protein
MAALVLTAVVYGTSAIAKLHSGKAYEAYREGLGGTALVPGRLLPVTAAVLAGAETAVAVAAAAALDVSWPAGMKVLPESALTAAALLTSVLAIGIVAVIRRGAVARCACFGSASARPLGRAQLTRNVISLAAIVTGLIACELSSGKPAPTAGAIAAAAGGVAGLLLDVFMPISAARDRTSG